MHQRHIHTTHRTSRTVTAVGKQQLLTEQRWSEDDVVTTTRTRLNAEPCEQNYSLPSSSPSTASATMHRRIIMSRGGGGGGISSSSRGGGGGGGGRCARARVQEMLRRSAVSATAPADVVPNGLTGDGSDEGRPCWTSNVRAVERSSCMFNVFRRTRHRVCGYSDPHTSSV